MRIPEWIVEGLKERGKGKELLHTLKSRGLATVCEEAQCPNIGTCFSNRTATFLLMGSVCTRNCRFCAIVSGIPEPLDYNEPQRVAEMVKSLGLSHAVITSVTRDDIGDGGAEHYVRTIDAVRKVNKGVTIEVLVPDFRGDEVSINKILDAKPEVVNHNIETIERLYDEVRPSANYERSLNLLSRVREKNNGIVTKSGMMVGLGEREEEVYETMDDLLGVGVQVLTIGQYLRPTRLHHNVESYVTPEEFERYRKVGIEKDFAAVASGPFVRSSYRAKELYREVKRQTV